MSTNNDGKTKMCFSVERCFYLLNECFLCLVNKHHGGLEQSADLAEIIQGAKIAGDQEDKKKQEFHRIIDGEEAQPSRPDAGAC